MSLKVTYEFMLFYWDSFYFDAIDQNTLDEVWNLILSPFLS